MFGYPGRPARGSIAPDGRLGLLNDLDGGKDADLLVLNGSPLDYRTYVEQALVNGRVAYKRDQAGVLPVYER